MRVRVAFGIIAILGVLLSTAAHAQEVAGTETAGETTQLPNPGILPDSPLYGLKRAFEGFQSLMKFSDKSKAEFHLALAGKRLAELKAMEALNRTEKYERLAEEYEGEINKSQDMFMEAKEKGMNVTSGLQKAAEMTTKHIAVLTSVKTKICEKKESMACTKLAFVIERSSTGNENILKMINKTMEKGQGIVKRVEERKDERKGGERNETGNVTGKTADAGKPENVTAGRPGNAEKPGKPETKGKP